MNARDGKPVFLNMGVHHAREWPSGEHAMEWAHELVKGYKAGDARVRTLMDATRTIVVPIVNPDGFNASREAGEDDGREGPDETANLAIPYEYHRKNCRVINPTGDDPAEGDCTQQPATGLQQFGVDPNRNYGGYWGGPGASAPGGTPPGDYAQDYRGPGPFSEPETQNIRDLVSKRQVVTLITNHTASNLILRPPGIQALGNSPDENLGYKALGDAMAAENGYTSQFGYELYDTTGTTEDWTYSATGGFGFTFEIGCEDKNEDTQECEGLPLPPQLPEGGRRVRGNERGGGRERPRRAGQPRGVLHRAWRAPRTPPGTRSSRATPRPAPCCASPRASRPAPRRSSTAEWRATRSCSTTSSRACSRSRPRGATPGTPTPRSGRRSRGTPAGPPPARPARPCEFTGGVTGHRASRATTASAVPGGDANSNDPMNNNDHVVEVPKTGGVDNAKVKIRVEWATPASDWDVRLYVDADADGVPDDPASSISASQTGPSSFEVVAASESVTDPALAPQYIVRVTNFAAAEGYTGTVTYEGPDPFVAAVRESWTLTCESQSGTVLQEREGRDRARPAQGGQLPGLRDGVPGGLQDRRGLRPADGPDQGQAARSRAPRPLARQNLQAYRISRRGVRNVDFFCLSDRRRVRVGYVSSGLRRRLTGREVRRLGTDKAILILTDSRRFRLKGLRPGSRASRLKALRVAGGCASCGSAGSGRTPGTSPAGRAPGWCSRSATSGCARSASPTSA